MNPIPRKEKVLKVFNSKKLKNKKKFFMAKYKFFDEDNGR